MKLKKLLKSGLALGLCFGLAACSSGSGKGASSDAVGDPAKTEKAESSQEKKAETDGKEIELKIPTYLAGENVGAVFFLPQVERFNKKYEGKYKVVVEEVVEDNTGIVDDSLQNIDAAIEKVNFYLRNNPEKFEKLERRYRAVVGQE